MTIVPCLHVTATADRDAERVQGVSVQLEDQQASEVGLRGSLRL